MRFYTNEKTKKTKEGKATPPFIAFSNENSLILNTIEKPESTKGVKAAVITLSNEKQLIVKKAIISQMSPKGFSLIFNYRDLVKKSLRFQLDLRDLWRKNIDMYIPDMKLDLDGKIIGAKHLGKGQFEVNIEFNQSAPLYWRECLFDLWPKRNSLSTI